MGVPLHSAAKPSEAEAERRTESEITSGGASGLLPEREALARLLASGEFQRSPNLEKILSYLCNQYFLGNGRLVKEYSIATEALDRRTDFDPKRDSIVRVEMHRLRRRLKEYYEGRGAAEMIRISIPEKSYIPEFQRVSLPVASSFTPPVEPEAATALPPEPPGAGTGEIAGAALPRRQTWPWWAALFVICGLGYSIYQFRPSDRPSAVAVVVPEVAPAAAQANATDAAPITSRRELRILAGRPKGRYPDRYGVVWQGDEFVQGGTSVPVQNEVHSRGFDSNLFSNMREGDFQYDIPLPPGSYELLLIFAETSFGEGNSFGGGETARIFHILLNGKALVTGLDVLAEAHDPNAATAKLFKDVQPDQDGKLHLRFQPSNTGKAFLNAMVIRPGIPGKIRPIRIVSRPNVYHDSSNQLWEPDHYYRGGVQITRPVGGALPKDPDLVRGERYGKFSYTIPVPPGKYQARLYFWEYWFGEKAPGEGGIGSRVFDVFCNFRPLITSLDIMKQRPKDRYVTQTFHGLEPNLDSKLIFEFVPKMNYALVNAIEITDDGVVLPEH